MENNIGVKYLTPEQQIIVKQDLKNIPSEKLKIMLTRFIEGGLKTCAELIKEELRLRMGTLNDNIFSTCRE
jgi:hypothetical protein